MKFKLPLAVPRDKGWIFSTLWGMVLVWEAFVSLRALREPCIFLNPRDILHFATNITLTDQSMYSNPFSYVWLYGIEQQCRKNRKANMQSCNTTKKPKEKKEYSEGTAKDFKACAFIFSWHFREQIKLAASGPSPCLKSPRSMLHRSSRAAFASGSTSSDWIL